LLLAVVVAVVVNEGLGLGAECRQVPKCGGRECKAAEARVCVPAEARALDAEV
jgi:hypothetical protein